MFRFGFWALATLIVGWTMIHTYDVLYMTNPIKENQFLAIYGLLVFEVGAIIWFGVFLRIAEGMGQHVIALFGAFIGLLLVSTAFVIDYTVPSSELAAYNSVARLAVIIATVVDLFFVFLFELFNPNVWNELQEHIALAMIAAKAEKKANQMIEKDSEQLAQKIAQNRKDRAFANAEISGIKPIPQQSNSQGGGQPRSMQPQMRPVSFDVPEEGVSDRPDGVPDANRMREIEQRHNGNGQNRPNDQKTRH
jgi:hypothetical protein